MERRRRQRLGEVTAAGWRRASLVAALQGLDGDRAVRSLRNVPRFLREWRSYSRQVGGRDPFRPSLTQLVPVLSEYDAAAGHASGHYFHQDLWAARRIRAALGSAEARPTGGAGPDSAELGSVEARPAGGAGANGAARPAPHVDVGSRVDGFVAHLLVFTEVTVVDVRPLESNVRGLRYVADDGRYLRSFADGSVTSLSSLHAIEHMGLGRYGDPVDPDGWRSALRSFSRVLAEGGRLYLSAPIGRERVQFNAHRVFHPERLPGELPDLRLTAFAAVDDDGDLVEGVPPSDFNGAKFACGLYEFAKG